MDKSSILTNWSVVLGVLGIAAWIIGGFLQWLGDKSFIFPFWHYWVDGGTLLLIAIWLKLGSIYHKQ